MAPAEKTETTLEAPGSDRTTPHHEGLNSGLSRGYASPVLSEDTDHPGARPGRGRTGFASVSGWVVCL
jgi:hypothetical protein